MISKRNVILLETLMTALIAVLAFSSFLTAASDKVAHAGKAANVFQTRVLLNTAMLYVVQHGFHPDEESDGKGEIMTLYIREKDGTPAMETAYPFPSHVGSMWSEQYLGVQIRHRAGSDSEYQLTVLERNADGNH